MLEERAISKLLHYSIDSQIWLLFLSTPQFPQNIP